jgi:hypothetical protein
VAGYATPVANEPFKYVVSVAAGKLVFSAMDLKRIDGPVLESLKVMADRDLQRSYLEYKISLLEEEGWGLDDFVALIVRDIKNELLRRDAQPERVRGELHKGYSLCGKFGVCNEHHQF